MVWVGRQVEKRIVARGESGGSLAATALRASPWASGAAKGWLGRSGEEGGGEVRSGAPATAVGMRGTAPRIPNGEERADPSGGGGGVWVGPFPWGRAAVETEVLLLQLCDGALQDKKGRGDDTLSACEIRLGGLIRDIPRPTPRPRPPSTHCPCPTLPNTAETPNVPMRVKESIFISVLGLWPLAFFCVVFVHIYILNVVFLLETLLTKRRNIIRSLVCFCRKSCQKYNLVFSGAVAFSPAFPLPAGTEPPAADGGSSKDRLQYWAKNQVPLPKVPPPCGLRGVAPRLSRCSWQCCDPTASRPSTSSSCPSGTPPPPPGSPPCFF